MRYYWRYCSKEDRDWFEDRDSYIAIGRRATWIYYPETKLWFVVTNVSSPEALCREKQKIERLMPGEFRRRTPKWHWVVWLENLLGTCRWSLRMAAKQKYPEIETMKPTVVPGTPSVDQEELGQAEINRHRRA